MNKKIYTLQEAHLTELLMGRRAEMNYGDPVTKADYILLDISQELRDKLIRHFLGGALNK